MELRAQFYCKTFARDIIKHTSMHPELTQKMREILPESAFPAAPATKSKASLSALMQDADNRSNSSDTGLAPHTESIAHDRC